MKVVITRDGLLNDAPVKKGESHNISDDQFNPVFMKDAIEAESETTNTDNGVITQEDMQTEETPKEEKPKKGK
jgi:histidinol phosphatase-like enzyme